MAGIDAHTGQPLDGFEHVQQSLERLFSTPQGSRVMREWVGNPGLKLLGQNATDQTILLWFTILFMLVELFEPRYRIVNFEVEDLSRLGFGDVFMNGQHRPFAHLDWQQAAAFISVTGGAVSLRPV